MAEDARFELARACTQNVFQVCAARSATSVIVRDLRPGISPGDLSWVVVTRQLPAVLEGRASSGTGGFRVRLGGQLSPASMANSKASRSSDAVGVAALRCGTARRIIPAQRVLSMRWPVPSVQLARTVHAAVLLVRGWPTVKRRGHQPGQHRAAFDHGPDDPAPSSSGRCAN